MNYTLQKLNCKPLIGAILSIIVALSLSTRAYAAYSMRLIPNFLFDKKSVYVAENISPRSSSLASVTISYDSLADLVYYCNEHGLSTTLAYNTALSVYVGFVSDSALDVKKFRVASLHGLLGSVDGKVYVAERKDSGGTTNNTYNYNQTIINNPSGTPSSKPGYGGNVSSSTSDRKLQEDLYYRVWYIGEYISILTDWAKFIDADVTSIFKHLDKNIVPALDAVNKNIIAFKDNAITKLRAIYAILDDSYDVQFNLLGVARSIYSSVSGIGSRLDSVISNGAVQVNTTSLEARLDKLISMYSNVNSVVLDTAAINGGQIKAAVGGELEDVVFWGNSVRSGSKFVTNTVQYALNGAVVRVYDISLRGLSIGNSVPDSVHVDDALIKSGIWQSGGKYRISDTYNAATGEYVQRVGSAVYDGSEAWKLVKKTDGCNLFYLVDSAFAGISGNTFCYSTRARFAYVPYDLALNTKPDAASAYANKFTVWGGLIRFCVPANDFPDLAAWTNGLANLSKAGTPLEVWYVRPSAVSTMLDRTFIGIPEGDSTIKADRIRITGKYETYDSYTQTADIINAINGIPTFDDTAVVGAITKLENALSKPSAAVTADLTEVTTRLDKLIENSASKVENVTVNITEDNDAFNVFYVTTDGGNKKPVGEVAGDTLSASGKLLNFLYKLCFEGALSKAGESIDTMSSFYFDTGAGTEGSVWD